jgi:hypothetical protein
MSVSLGHLDISVTEDLLQIVNLATVHDVLSGEGVPKIMQSDRLHPRPSNTQFEGATIDALERPKFANAVWKYKLV